MSPFALAEKITEANLLDMGDHKCSIGLYAETRAAKLVIQSISRQHSFHSLQKNIAFIKAFVLQSGPPSAITVTTV